MTSRLSPCLTFPLFAQVDQLSSELLHVVVTGRNAKPELIEAADLVTEMTQIKHPFREQNVRAQKGIEF